MSTHCPFFASGYIKSLERFIGRTDELALITHRLTGLQPTSVNVYGPRRIGKSSLLYHFYLTWENRVKPEERAQFAVVYVSVAGMETEAEFYQTLAKAWWNYAPLQKNVTWKKTWHSSAWTRASFKEALKTCQETVKVLPVVCLDDIEMILRHSTDHPPEFDNGFFDNLRSAMGSSQLMLVIASFKPLHDYKNDYGLTSLFFNQGQSLELKVFEASEVQDYIKVKNKDLKKRKGNPISNERRLR